MKPPLDQNPFDPRQKGKKWLPTFPLNLLHKQEREGKVRESNRRTTSFLLVVLISPTLDIDVQAPSTRGVLKEKKNYVLPSIVYMLRKIDLSILNQTT